MKKILLYLIAILSSFIFISKPNASVTINGSTLKRNEVIYNGSNNVTIGITSAPVTLKFGQREHILYGLVMLCTNNKSLQNTTDANVSVQYTDIACTLPPNIGTEWPDGYQGDTDQIYDGNIVYILVNWNTTNDIPDNNYLTKSYNVNFSIANSKWNTYALINDMYSFNPIDFDLSSKTLIEQNKEIIKQNKDTIEKLEEQNQKVQQQIQEQEKTNEELGELNDNITNSDSPDNMDGLSNSAGWLPAGPLDSLLNLPLSMLNNISSNLSKSCQPVNLPLPFVDKTLPLPCLSSIYSQIDGLGPWITTISVIGSAFILFSYLLKLYKWVDDTLTFRENHEIDNWGGL